MAELEISNKNKKHSKKKNIRIDLTPMVDLGFLLITFFVFTTTLSEAKAMEVNTPFESNIKTSVCNSCALTVLLNKNNDIYYYEGAFENAVVHQSSYKEIRNEIMRKKAALIQLRGNANDFSLIIKAADSASFNNFVDITDEVAINRIPHYFIDEITDAEKQQMQ